MKSTAVYKILREVTDAWSKVAGFKRGSGSMLSYARPAPGATAFQTFWFQCSQDGWDAYTGSKFTLVFQEASEPDPGHGGRRSRFVQLLTSREREQVRSLQNNVIEKLRAPPHDHWAHTLDAGTRKSYFARFDRIASPYQESEDVWMRYADEADVRRWGDFLVPLLPRLIEDFHREHRPGAERA